MSNPLPPPTMSKPEWTRLGAQAFPHLLVLLGVGMAWAVFRSGVEWAEPWGWLGALALLVHLGLMFIPGRIFRPLRLRWAQAQWSSDVHAPSNGAEMMANVMLEWPRAMRTMALAALTVALFRPQTASTVENMTREGIDLVLSMDLSASMLSKDFKPNRLESAKEVAMEFVDRRPFDRIGVVAYEGEAFTQVPITTDHIVVKNGIKALDTGMLEGGTAIGTGLAVAVNRLRASEAKSKVIVLLTDGENNAGQMEPLDAAQLARLNGIRVYTIGVGTIGKAKSPVAIRANGTYQYDWVDVRIDEPSLQRIAELTDGRYFRATNMKKLKEIYAEIDALEKTEFNVLRYQRKSEAGAAWIAMALFAMGMEMLLRTTLFKSLQA